jgi:hypothetical protein
MVVPQKVDGRSSVVRVRALEKVDQGIGKVMGDLTIEGRFGAYRLAKEFFDFPSSLVYVGANGVFDYPGIESNKL